MITHNEGWLVEKDDVWILLMCTIRYALGRRSYITSLAPELVLKYARALTSEQIRQLCDEIMAELKVWNMRGDTLGDNCDDANWRNAVSSFGRILVERDQEKELPEPVDKRMSTDEWLNEVYPECDAQKEEEK